MKKQNNIPQKQKGSFIQAMKRILSEMSSLKYLWISALILALIANLIAIFSPKLMSTLVDEISLGIAGPNASINLDKVNKLSLILVILYVISSAFSYIQSFIMADVSNNFARDLRMRVSNKINKLPLNYFDKNQIGDILSRITNDVDTIAMNLNQSLSSLGTSVIMLIGTLIMMFITNWILALVALLSTFIGFISMGMVIGKSQVYYKERQEHLGNINGHIEEMFSGINIVNVYNAKDEVSETFHELNQKIYNADVKSKFLSGIMHPMMMFVGNLGYVAVAIVGAILANNGYITFGVIVAFFTYVRLFSQNLGSMAQVMTSLQSVSAASDRVFNFMDEEELSKEAEKSVLSTSNVKGKIEFKDVVFQYPGNEKPTINGFSATALPGQKIAIVGPTGAGKSTMVNLLMKFYEISDGDILIDGVSIHDIKREDIHDMFTMVLQDTWLFKGTIRENIVYNNKNVSEEELLSLSKFIGLQHFINTLPKGFDTEISDSESVSAGQRQLLTIARGMLKDSPFLILDEATSNVDTRTEEVVQAAMDKLMYGKTSFIIAHRLSTIVNSDLILVMNEGNVIESGTHEELLSQNGFYADLYNSQFSL